MEGGKEWSKEWMGRKDKTKRARKIRKWSGGLDGEEEKE